MNREVFIERARESAELTIPHLFPPKGSNESTNFPTPYQSVGSRGVMNLSSKLMLALFPPQAPFFRLGIDDLVRAIDIIIEKEDSTPGIYNVASFNDTVYNIGMTIAKKLNISRKFFEKPYIKDSRLVDLSYRNGFGMGTCNIRIHNRDKTEYVTQALKYISKLTLF